MFIERKEYVTFKHDLQGRELCKRTETVYVFNGQEINEDILRPETQAYYKGLFKIQENKTIELGRPISILEVLFPLDKIL